MGRAGRYPRWVMVLASLATVLDTGGLVTFADVLLDVDDNLVRAAIEAVDAHDAWDTLVRIALAADDLDAEVRTRLRRLVDELPDAYADAFRRRAETLGHPDLLDRVLDN